MSVTPARNRAVLPPRNYERPALFDAEALVVQAVGEGGEDLGEHRFDELAPRTPLLESLVHGFALAAGPEGKWKSRHSLHQNANCLKRFYRDLQQLDTPPRAVQDITPEVWLGWRDEIRSKQRWPGLISSVRSLLHATPGVPDDVRLLLWRRNSKPKKRFVVKAYTRAEFQRIKSAAWRTVDRAADRIRTSLSMLQEYRDADGAGVPLTRSQARRGRILEQLAGTGTLPRRPSGQLRSWQFQGLVPEGSGARPQHALFLSTGETFAFMVLFAALRGYNPETIADLTVNHQRPDGGTGPVPIRNIGLRKRRLGSSRQYLQDNLVGGRTRSAEGLYTLALELTQPARDVLAARGEATERLLIARAITAPAGRNPFIVELNRTGAARAWESTAGLTGDDGEPLTVSLQRVRLTEQVLHRMPRMNSQAVHDDVYVLREPAIAKEAAATIASGQQYALEHAQVTVAMRTWTDSQIAHARQSPTEAAEQLGIAPERLKLLLAGHLNTPVGACLDFECSPLFDGQACKASFLMCLSCSNAVATPEHLPRLVCLHDALKTIGSAVTVDVWKADYAEHFARLDHILEARSTAAERDAARTRTTLREREEIEALLRRKLDA